MKATLLMCVLGSALCACALAVSPLSSLSQLRGYNSRLKNAHKSVSLGGGYRRGRKQGTNVLPSLSQLRGFQRSGLKSVSQGGRYKSSSRYPSVSLGGGYRSGSNPVVSHRGGYKSSRKPVVYGSSRKPTVYKSSRKPVVYGSSRMPTVYKSSRKPNVLTSPNQLRGHIAALQSTRGRSRKPNVLTSPSQLRSQIAELQSTGGRSPKKTGTSGYGISAEVRALQAILGVLSHVDRTKQKSSKTKPGTPAEDWPACVRKSRWCKKCQGDDEVNFRTYFIKEARNRTNMDTRTLNIFKTKCRKGDARCFVEQLKQVKSPRRVLGIYKKILATDVLFRKCRDWVCDNGRLCLGDIPGLGVTIKRLSKTCGPVNLEKCPLDKNPKS